jgi:hypothetical protein
LIKEAKPMARTNTYKCAVCGTTYEFCLKCQVSRPDYDAEKFCSHNHADIFAILSKHGCNLITAEEALKELSAYNLDEITLTESIQAHINKIKAEATVNTEEPTVTVESETITPVVKEVIEELPIVKSNKNNKKKKW